MLDQEALDARHATLGECLVVRRGAPHIGVPFGCEVSIRLGLKILLEVRGQGLEGLLLTLNQTTAGILQRRLSRREIHAVEREPGLQFLVNHWRRWWRRVVQRHRARRRGRQVAGVGAGGVHRDRARGSAGGGERRGIAAARYAARARRPAANRDGSIVRTGARAGDGRGRSDFHRSRIRGAGNLRRIQRLHCEVGGAAGRVVLLGLGIGNGGSGGGGGGGGGAGSADGAAVV